MTHQPLLIPLQWHSEGLGARVQIFPCYLLIGTALSSEFQCCYLFPWRSYSCLSFWVTPMKMKPAPDGWKVSTFQGRPKEASYPSRVSPLASWSLDNWTASIIQETLISSDKTCLVPQVLSLIEGDISGRTLTLLSKIFCHLALGLWGQPIVHRPGMPRKEYAITSRPLATGLIVPAVYKQSMT